MVNLQLVILDLNHQSHMFQNLIGEFQKLIHFSSHPFQYLMSFTFSYDVSNESKIACPQLTMIDAEFRGQEDCLFLNVYVPEEIYNDQAAKASVMVWIHGGALTLGSNNYVEQGPQHFMDKGVVIVTINYRLDL